MKIVKIKGLWLLHLCTKLHIDISSRLWGIGVWNVKNRTHTHTHTSGRQLKIIFLEVLDYSEYSDTNIWNKNFSRKHSFLSEESKCFVFQLWFVSLCLLRQVFWPIIATFSVRDSEFSRKRKFISNIQKNSLYQHSLILAFFK